jgi:hypothetical protein
VRSRPTAIASPTRRPDDSGARTRSPASTREQMTIRTYKRRSKNDEGKQQFSLDVQTRGCEDHIARMGCWQMPSAAT